MIVVTSDSFSVTVIWEDDIEITGASGSGWTFIVTEEDELYEPCWSV